MDDDDELSIETIGWDKYDDWVATGDDEDEEDIDYLFELFSAAADVEKCLDMAWGSLMMQGFVWSASKAQRALTGVMLTENEVKMTANQQYVDWEGFHTEIIVKIFENRATNNNNAAKRIVSYDDWKFDYIKKMSGKHPAELSDADVAKKQKWGAIVFSFGIEFAKILESTIATGGHDLWSDIDQVLSMHHEWMPADGNSQRKIYYIAGFLINAVKKNPKRNISSGAINLFLTNASLERQVAADAGLPIEDVVEREVDQLQCASRDFYNVTIKLECVFYHILGEKSIEIFGPQIIADLEACLNKVDIGIASLLTGWEDNDDISNVRERVIEAFCNMRGKDYVRKRRALAGFNFTETHRSTIGTIAKQAKDKANKKRTEEENAVVVIDNEIKVDAMLCNELRAELKKWKLFVTGKKAELQTRSRQLSSRVIWDAEPTRLKSQRLHPPRANN